MAARMARATLEDYNALRIDPEEPPQATAGGDRRSGIKKINFPRVGKKLAVLGLEDVLCDITTRCVRTIGRPFLHDFLGKLYKYYDIAIWSDRRMDQLESLIDCLGMDRHPDYNIICYVDSSEILTLGLPAGRVLVKPLEIIWREYPDFNETNTIICDNRQDKIIWNFENGIVIRRYIYYNYDEDKELLLLWTYLKSIAHNENVSKVDHSTWKYRVRRSKRCNCVVL